MNQYTNTGSDVQHADLYLTGRLQREMIVANNGAIPVQTGDAFIINADGVVTISMTGLNTSCAGQSGTIVIVNSAGGSDFSQLPAYMLTPSGADIEFVTEPYAVSIISYHILSQTQVLCNYIGHFA